MGGVFKILVADRNRRVCDFLRRELLKQGYDVQTAIDGRQIMTLLEGEDPPHLLVLDMEMPYVSGFTILESIRERGSALPVVIHTFLSEGIAEGVVSREAVFVEKKANIDSLKAAIEDMLRRFYPDRFSNDTDA